MHHVTDELKSTFVKKKMTCLPPNDPRSIPCYKLVYPKLHVCISKKNDRLGNECYLIHIK